jgi:hypothetical protein
MRHINKAWLVLVRITVGVDRSEPFYQERIKSRFTGLTGI